MSAKVISPFDFHLLCIHNQDSQALFSNLSRPSSFLSTNSCSRGRIKAKTRARTIARARAATIDEVHSGVQSSESLYDLLGVSETGTLSDIKQAYKQLARRYHPDVSPLDRREEYTKKFIAVQEAYETLSNPQARASYDLHLIHMLSYRRRPNSEEDCRKQWESQLNELRPRSMNKDSAVQTSWGTRMRRRRNSMQSKH